MNYDAQNNRYPSTLTQHHHLRRRRLQQEALQHAQHTGLEHQVVARNQAQGYSVSLFLENEPAPWERTYHSAEFLFPYLVVFGGEGVADLDDLWVFNFLTLSWKEVHIPKNKVRPCARRFHSSALVKN